MTHPKRTAAIVVPGVLGFVLVFGAWELFVAARDITPLVLPAPSAIASNVVDHAGAYADDARITLMEAVLGFALAFVVSAVVAIGMVHSPLFRRTVDPLAIALRCMPVVAFAPALALWLGFGSTPKVVVAALITFPPFLVNMVTGLRFVDVGMLEVLQSVNASAREVLLNLRIPNALPYVFSAMKVCVSLALIGAVVGEFAGSSEGLGYRIVRSQRDLETTTVWGAIAVLALAGVLLTLLVEGLERRVLHWKKVDQLAKGSGPSPRKGNA